MKTLRAKSLDNSAIFGVLLFLILALEAWLRYQRLDMLAWNNDEAIYLTAARLVSKGYRPYSEVAFTQLPLFLEIIRLPLAWTDSVTVVRGVISIFGVLEIVGVALIGRSLNENIAGWAAAIFLALTSSFFYYSRAIMADIPSVALGIWSIWAGWRYYQTGQRGWLIVSGLLMGLSLAVKFLTIYAVGWIILLILFDTWHKKSKTAISLPERSYMIQNILIFGGCTGLTLVGILVWYDMSPLLSSAFGMRVAMREAFGGLLDSNLDVLIEFWQFHAALIILAIYGLLTQLHRSAHALLLLAWLGLILLSLFNQSPLHRQHLQLLPPVLAILAGVGVGSLVKTARTLRVKTQIRTGVWFLAGIVLVTWYLFFTWHAYSQVTPFTETSPNPLNDQDHLLADYLQTFTTPNDCLVTDSLTLAFVSDRLPPPPLADVSSARLRSGFLTYEQLVSNTQQYRCQAIAPIAKRLKRSRADFVEWGKAKFLGLWLYDGETEVLLAQPLSDPQPVIPIQATFSNQVILEGADIINQLSNQNRTLYISLYWRPMRPFSEDYTIFVHLRDADNATIANADHQPYNNLVPTSRWPVDRTVKESIRLELPPEITPGTYRLMVGLYLPHTLERLPVQGDTSGENAVTLTEVLVNP